MACLIVYRLVEGDQGPAAAKIVDHPVAQRLVDVGREGLNGKQDVCPAKKAQGHVLYDIFPVPVGSVIDETADIRVISRSRSG